MDAETAKAWAEQQAREIRNLKTMRKSERKRAVKIVGSYKKQLIKGSSSELILRKVMMEINNQRKKDKDDGSKCSLSGDTKQIRGKTNKEEHMPVEIQSVSNALVCGNHVDNPQDDPGKASGADNGDTGDGTFPADSKLPKGFKEGKCKCGNSYGYCGVDISYCVKCLDKMETKKYNEEWDSYYDEEKDIWLERICQNKDCEVCSNRPTKPSECVEDSLCVEK